MLIFSISIWTQQRVINSDYYFLYSVLRVTTDQNAYRIIKLPRSLGPISTISTMHILNSWRAFTLVTFPWRTCQSNYIELLSVPDSHLAPFPGHNARVGARTQDLHIFNQVIQLTDYETPRPIRC